MAPPKSYLRGAEKSTQTMSGALCYARFSPQKKRATVPGPV